MRLDWNDIKARAATFAGDWKDAHYERGETQTFYNEFFELFGVTRRRVASFEHGVDLPEKKRGYLDLFWKGKLLVEQKSAGRSRTPARKQALDYFPGLKDHELPRYILLSDFQNFELCRLRATWPWHHFVFDVLMFCPPLFILVILLSWVPPMEHEKDHEKNNQVGDSNGDDGFGPRCSGVRGVHHER